MAKLYKLKVFEDSIAFGKHGAVTQAAQEWELDWYREYLYRLGITFSDSDWNRMLQDASNLVIGWNIYGQVVHYYMDYFYRED